MPDISTHPENALMDQQWVEGFLTALTWVAPGGLDPMSGVPDREAIHAWIDNYCRSRPVDPIVDAVMEFANERWRVMRSTTAP